MFCLMWAGVGAGGVLHSTMVGLSLNPNSPGFVSHLSRDFFSLLLSLWAVEISEQSNAYLRDFANAVSGEGLS